MSVSCRPLTELGQEMLIANLREVKPFFCQAYVRRMNHRDTFIKHGKPGPMGQVSPAVGGIAGKPPGEVVSIH